MGQHQKIVDFSGYGLTTAQILYRMPDHHDLLQTFVWQEYDRAPSFPNLSRFLAFWREQIEGPLHSVSISHRALVTPLDVRIAQLQFAVN